MPTYTPIASAVTVASSVTFIWIKLSICCNGLTRLNPTGWKAGLRGRYIHRFVTSLKHLNYGDHPSISNQHI